MKGTMLFLSAWNELDAFFLTSSDFNIIFSKETFPVKMSPPFMLSLHPILILCMAFLFIYLNAYHIYFSPGVCHHVLGACISISQMRVVQLIFTV